MASSGGYVFQTRIRRGGGIIFTSIFFAGVGGGVQF